MSEVIVAYQTRDLDELAEQLAGWLARRLPEANGIQVANCAYPFGAGRSHETILFDASWNEGGRRVERGCVLRIKPSDHDVFPDDLFEEEYKLMQALHVQGAVRVAAIYWVEDDPSIVGAPFFVMERKHGRVPVVTPLYSEEGWVAEATPAQRRTLWENGVRQLGAIQSVPLQGLGFLKGPAGAEEGLAQEWDKYLRFVRWVQEVRPWPALDASLAKLKAGWPANQPPGLVWGDARLGNIMFGDDFEVVAVMDWEQPSLGGALHDLAWWLYMSDMFHGERPGRPHLAGMGTREETIALWQEVTGISAADIGWYEEFARLKLTCTSIRMSDLRGWLQPSDEELAVKLEV
jgi:aminoglycoside phosphotransferase (APT) family kinase protein